MKLGRVYTGDDGESHVESLDSSEFDYVERNGTRTEMLPTTSANFLKREAGPVGEFHNAPRLQYVVRSFGARHAQCAPHWRSL